MTDFTRLVDRKDIERVQYVYEQALKLIQRAREQGQLAAYIAIPKKESLENGAISQLAELLAPVRLSVVQDAQKLAVFRVFCGIPTIYSYQGIKFYDLFSTTEEKTDALLRWIRPAVQEINSKGCNHITIDTYEPLDDTLFLALKRRIHPINVSNSIRIDEDGDPVAQLSLSWKSNENKKGCQIV